MSERSSSIVNGTIRAGGLRRLLLVPSALAAMLAPQLVRAEPPAELARAEAARQVHFDIPAQDIDSALTALADQANLRLLFKSGDVAGMKTQGLSGSFTADEALRRLLAGTGMIWRFTAVNTVALEKVATTGALELGPVTVEGAAGTEMSNGLPPSYAGGQVARGGRLGLLGNKDMMDTPFSTSSYTAQKIQNQQARTVAEVASSDPSVRSSGPTGGMLDSFFIRGFPVGEGNLGEITFDGVYGVAPNYRVMSDYAERIEVIKGPTALLYGMAPNSSIGGGINIVPKRASDVDLTRFTADYAGNLQSGGHVDVSRRFGTDRALGVRFNGSYHDGDTPLDNQSRTARVGALAVDYRSEQFRASVDLIDQNEKFDAPARPFLVAAGVPVPSAPNGRRNVTQSWEWSDVGDQSALLRTEYDVSDHLTLFANGGGGQTQVARLFGTPTILNSFGDTTTTPGYFKFEVERWTSDAGLRARFVTAALDHAVTFQATRYHDILRRGSTTASQVVLSNIYSPFSRNAQSVTAPATVPKISETELNGFALADTISVSNERVQLTLGMRQQQVESDNFSATTGAVTSSYDQTAVTPMVGLVVKPWQNVSFYANYIEGLSKGDIAPQIASNAGETLAPYVSKQHEVGVKLDFGRLVTTISAFQITKPNGQLTGTVYGADGEQRNRGLEFTAFGEIDPILRLLAGVTLLDAELTKTNSAATVGNAPIGVPEVQVNLGAEWDTPFMPRLTLTGSAVYTGGQHLDTANTQSIPAWVTLDLGARYRTAIAEKQLAFRATVQNVLDTEYWSGVASWGGLSQGAPRNVLLSVETDF